MEQEEQVKDQQGANGVAPAIMLPVMSSFPSLMSILFSLQLPAYLPILHRIVPPHRTSVWGAQKGHRQGFKAGPLGFKVTQSN